MDKRLRGAGSGSVRLWARRRETLEEAVRLGVCSADEVSETIPGAVAGADLAVICTPPEAVAEIAAEAAAFMPEGGVITDVASVKGPVTRMVAQTAAAGRFIGSHPMAGSHESGVSAARDGLFQNAVCIITPAPSDNAEALARVRALWERLGCRLFAMTPEAHDRAVAAMSHLPHAAAAALVNFVCALPDDPAKFCGNGFRDTTRVAGGPPGMWAEIFMLNRDNILAGLSGFAAELERLAALLRAGDRPGVEAVLEEARRRRAALGSATPSYGEAR